MFCTFCLLPLTYSVPIYLGILSDKSAYIVCYLYIQFIAESIFHHNDISAFPFLYYFCPAAFILNPCVYFIYHVIVLLTRDAMLFYYLRLYFNAILFLLSHNQSSLLAILRRLKINAALTTHVYSLAGMLRGHNPTRPRPRPRPRPQPTRPRPRPRPQPTRPRPRPRPQPTRPRPRPRPRPIYRDSYYYYRF